MRRLVFALLILALPVASYSQEKKAPKKKPVAAKKQQKDDWGRFNASSKRELDAADRKKAEKAAKK